MSESESPRLLTEDAELIGFLDEALVCSKEPCRIWVQGWILHRCRTVSRLEVGLSRTSEIPCFRTERFDVAKAFSDLPGNQKAGFCARFTVPASHRSSDPLALFFSAYLDDGTVTIGTFDSVWPASPETSPSPEADESLGARQIAKKSFSLAAKIELERFLTFGESLHFPPAAQPILSIVIVVFNRAELALLCLQAVRAELVGDIPTEVILVDNASEDATPALTERLRGITLIRNNRNQHFIFGANQGARAARGECLLFLNSDSFLQPGSLQRAVTTLRANPRAGAVGGRLIYPEGTLQEAGAILWNDGRTVGYGKEKCPESSEYLFQREVTYCSCAFLLTRTELFRELGGFSEAFSPAYYEDVDYCIRLQKHGATVLYEPDALVMHVENGSVAEAQAPELRKLIRRNQCTLVERHSDYLSLCSPPFLAYETAARFAFDRKKLFVVLVIERIPIAEEESADREVAETVRALVNEGARVTLFPILEGSLSRSEAYRFLSQGVEVISKFKHSSASERVPLFDFIFGRGSCIDVLDAIGSQASVALRSALSAIPKDHWGAWKNLSGAPLC